MARQPLKAQKTAKNKADEFNQLFGTEKFGNPRGDIRPTDRQAKNYDPLQPLRDITDDPMAPAAARASAARTLLEAMGIIGRHAVPPSEQDIIPLTAMSLGALQAELDALRQAYPALTRGQEGA